ncbi:MAG: hypothetical protein NZM06_08965 [Chloroherpetonaceae bacterium]|nr:hypothetical protein [Chloroherpetonaceae bacterium]MDW8437872.1 hypothetical protein [Chloroherpetonaceae bacterium]
MSNIIPYLRYLREMSRKILMNKGFENVLYKKPRGQNPLYSEYPQVNLNYWQLAEDQIRKAERNGVTMRLFVGLGLCVGRFNLQAARQRRHLAAPLLYAPIELDRDEDSNEILPYERWEELTLNYDLLTILLGNEPQEGIEMPSPNAKSQALQLNTDAYEEIAKIEQEIEATDPNSEPNLAHRFFERLRARIPAISDCDVRESLSIADAELAHALERLMQDRLTFFKHRFFFLAVVPDELTAFEELKTLLDQAEH